MSDIYLGTEATKDFYEQTGWHKQDGVLVDSVLFTPLKVGPILKSIYKRREADICELVGGPRLNLVECGSGGKPATFLSGRCERFTAVDFSAVGLSEAAQRLEATGLMYRTVEADITRLPFPDGEFDVAYSAHVLYHIANPEGQAAALAEMMRVVRPGGRVVLVLANPFPLLFPGRFARRILAVTPGLKTLLNKVRAKPALPYRPMPIGWYKRELSKWGAVRVLGNALPSTWFDRNVSEHNVFTRSLWKMIARLEEHYPKAASRLGCYVVYCATRRATD